MRPGWIRVNGVEYAEDPNMILPAKKSVAIEPRTIYRMDHVVERVVERRVIERVTEAKPIFIIASATERENVSKSLLLEHYRKSLEVEKEKEELRTDNESLRVKNKKLLKMLDESKRKSSEPSPEALARWETNKKEALRKTRQVEADIFHEEVLEELKKDARKR
ncbi:hypothetical protein MUP77_09385 [Candidatus Bathyarchaeota archaeon]|nr:hypothetical protein [Candidatus Bathyarchaeota archaeon]